MEKNREIVRFTKLASKIFVHDISSFVVKKDNRQRVNPLFHSTFQKLRLLLELAKENLSGFHSRRIDESNRLVYTVEEKQIVIISCRYHY